MNLVLNLFTHKDKNYQKTYLTDFQKNIMFHYRYIPFLVHFYIYVSFIVNKKVLDVNKYK